MSKELKTILALGVLIKEVNMNSILTSIKQLLGLIEEDVSFDNEIVIYINSAFMSLMQIGVGPVEGFNITDKTTEWSDFTDRTDISSIKTYIYLKVRLLFDPPTSSSILDAFERQILQHEWRLNTQVEEPIVIVEESE
jgi:hypothetical protein